MHRTQHVGYRLIDGHTGFATPPALLEVPEIFLALLRHCIARASAVSPVVDVTSQAIEIIYDRTFMLRWIACGYR